MGYHAGAFLMFPLGVMVTMIILEASFASGASLNGSSNVSFCQTPGCPSSSQGVTKTCQGFVPCKILPNCPADLPAPAWCFPWPFNLVSTNQGAWLNPGTSVFLPAATVAAGQSAGAAVFGFSVAGAQGYTTALVIGIGVAVLAGLTILGTGVQGESIHILFMGGMLLGVWLILAGIDGFIFGNPNSVFSQLNKPVPNGGSFVFGLMTLSWLMGTVGAVSRGGGV